MAQALGIVTKGEDGNFAGRISMGINTKIEIVANDAKETDRQPDFRIFSTRLGEIGGGWNKVGENSGKPYVSLTLAHPMIGSRKVYANLGLAHGGEDNEFAVLWNPQD